MQLWEDQAVVHALEHALKSYDYLEYDEAGSKHINALKVRVKADHLNADRDISVAGKVCRALEKETGRRFLSRVLSLTVHKIGLKRGPISMCANYPSIKI